MLKLSEILLCNQALNSQNLQFQCGIDVENIEAFGCSKPVVAAANTPYLIGNDSSGVGRSILAQLSPAPVAKALTDLSLSYGGDNVVALAEMTAKFKEFNLGLIGASTSVYAHRVGGFAGSVKDYQGALMEYRQAVKLNSPTKAATKQKAYVAFQKMQGRFRHELNVVTAQVKSRRGTPLTSPDRATNIARSSRNVTKLSVSNHVQASNLVKLSKRTKLLGSGLAVVDFGGRVRNIHSSYQDDRNWERDLFIESSSFAASALTGTAVVNAGGAALGFLVVATPIGWVGLIVGGVVVAGVAAAASVGMNSYTKDNSGNLYDDIMKVASKL